MRIAAFRAYLLGLAEGAPPRGCDPAIAAALEDPSVKRSSAAWRGYAQAEAAPAGDGEAPALREKLPWHQLPPLP